MATLGMMRILIPEIWVNRTYVHDLTIGLRNLGHEVEVASEAFWAGPGRHDILLWLWPEGFFRHSLGGKLRLLTDHLKQDFFQQLEAWQNAVPTVEFYTTGCLAIAKEMQDGIGLICIRL